MPIRLNLGCGQEGMGQKYFPGWKNHDSEVDMLKLPYERNSVDEIAVIHMFEHLSHEKVQDYLAHWFDILKPGGLLAIEIPSMDKIAKMILDGEENHRLTLLGIFGDERYNEPLMLHKWCYTNREIQWLLESAGFETEFKEPVFHIAKRDLRIEGRKHGTTSSY